jgi:hypothetical protein
MITQAYLKSLLNYDKDTGLFFWKNRPESFFKSKRAYVQWNKRYADKLAGTTKNDSGYVIISINKELFRAHRLAWMFVYGTMPTNQIDHINGVRNDNRLGNLRDTKQGENHKNKRLLSTNKTGYHGITMHTSGKYRVKAWSKNVQYNLGYYLKIDDAIAARKKFEAENGYHQNHGLAIT